MIELHCEPAALRPGQAFTVRLRWELEERPERLVVNLLWYTSGKGDEDIRVVTGETLEDPGPGGERVFEFTAPLHPPSFSGRLISLSWALEALVDPGQQVERLELVIGPEAAEVQLPVPDGQA